MARSATSYRQLTDGRLLGHERALLAVRVLRAEGWSDEDLRRALSSAVRKVRRRLGPLPARPLGESAALRVLGELAHHDGAQPAQESWQAMQLGGLVQTTFRLRRWPDLRVDDRPPAGAPAAGAARDGDHGVGQRRAVAGHRHRRGAGGPDGTARRRRPGRPLDGDAGTAPAARRRTGQGRRLDGEQLDGFAATLPLGAPVPADRPGRRDDAADGGPGHPGAAVGTAGLMLGANRHGAPVTARLFRAEATRVVLIGGVRAAQLVVLRAMALGARIVVQTARPQAWEPFVRGVSAPGGPSRSSRPGGRSTVRPVRRCARCSCRRHRSGRGRRASPVPAGTRAW